MHILKFAHYLLENCKRYAYAEICTLDCSTPNITALSVNKARVRNSRSFSPSCLSRPVAAWPAEVAWREKSGIFYSRFIYVQCSNVGCGKILAQDLDDDQVSKEFVLILIKMYQGNRSEPLEIVVELENAGKKYPDLMKFILEHEDIKSEVMVCCLSGLLYTTMVMLYGMDDANSFPGLTPIHLAAFYGLTGTVGKLLKKYDSPDVKTKPYGGSPLYCAAFNGHLETVKFLTGLTFTPNAPDRFGKTPLWKAAYLGHAEIANFLVTKVENPNSPDKNGITPLDIAIRQNHIEIVKILVSHLENPNAPNLYGNRSIHEAAHRNCQDFC